MEEQKNNPSYYAVIPSIVRYDEKLNANAKLLFAELTALANLQGYAFASNKYFADLYKVDTRTIQRWLTLLQDRKYIQIFVVYKDNSKEVLKRKISIDPLLTKLSPPPTTKLSPPPDKNVVDNNINIINKKKNIKRKRYRYDDENVKPQEIISHNYTKEQWNAVYTSIEDLDFN